MLGLVAALKASAARRPDRSHSLNPDPQTADHHLAPHSAPAAFRRAGDSAACHDRSSVPRNHRPTLQVVSPADAEHWPESALRRTKLRLRATPRPDHQVPSRLTATSATVSGERAAPNRQDRNPSPPATVSTRRGRTPACRQAAIRSGHPYAGSSASGAGDWACRATAWSARASACVPDPHR